MEYSQLSSSVHGIPQARILEWISMPSYRGSFQPRDWTHVSCIGRQFFTAVPPKKPVLCQKTVHSSVQFSSSVVSDSLRPHGLQHARLPCPSPTPGACSNSCPWSRWCHPTISSCVVPFSSCLQSFPTSGSFPMSQFFTSGGQSIGVSGSASVLPVNIQNWFPLGLTGLISLLFKGLSRVFSNTPGNIRTRIKSSLWSVLLPVKEKFRELRTMMGICSWVSLNTDTTENKGTEYWNVLEKGKLSHVSLLWCLFMCVVLRLPVSFVFSSIEHHLLDFPLCLLGQRRPRQYWSSCWLPYGLQQWSCGQGEKWS